MSKTVQESTFVNVVIFPGGKFCENVGKDISRGGEFSGYYSYFLHKGIWVLFLCGAYFHK